MSTVIKSGQPKTFSPTSDEYRRLRATLGKLGPPLNVLVSGSGRVDLGLPMFASGEVPALIVTTTAGAMRLRKQRAPDSVEIRAVRSAGTIRAGSIIEQVCKVSAGKLILVEGGPRLLSHFFAAHVLDEQFLTLSPRIAGRDVGGQRLSLVMGRTFAPRSPLWGTLIDLRRGSNHLFLRYSFA